MNGEGLCQCRILIRIAKYSYIKAPTHNKRSGVWVWAYRKSGPLPGRAKPITNINPPNIKAPTHNKRSGLWVWAYGMDGPLGYTSRTHNKYPPNSRARTMNRDFFQISWRTKRCRRSGHDSGVRWLDHSEERNISERSAGQRVRPHTSAARAHNRHRTADAAQPTL